MYKLIGEYLNLAVHALVWCKYHFQCCLLLWGATVGVGPWHHRVSWERRKGAEQCTIVQIFFIGSINTASVWLGQSEIIRDIIPANDPRNISLYFTLETCVGVAELHNSHQALVFWPLIAWSLPGSPCLARQLDVAPGWTLHKMLTHDCLLHHHYHDHHHHQCLVEDRLCLVHHTALLPSYHVPCLMFILLLRPAI